VKKLKDVFKKIAGIFGIEKEESPHLENDYSHDVEVRSELQVRTKSVYPQNITGSKQFRFPVIPDSINEERSKERKPSVKESSAVAAPSRKKPFQPTEVISPIYGRKHPSSLKKEKKVEYTSNQIIHMEQVDQLVSSINRDEQNVKHDRKADHTGRDQAEIPTIEIESIPRNERPAQREQAVNYLEKEVLVRQVNQVGTDQIENPIEIESIPLDEQTVQGEQARSDQAEIPIIEIESIPHNEQPAQMEQAAALHVEYEILGQQEEQARSDQAEIPIIEIESMPHNEQPAQMEQAAALYVEDEILGQQEEQVERDRAEIPTIKIESILHTEQSTLNEQTADQQWETRGHAAIISVEEGTVEVPQPMQSNNFAAGKDEPPVLTSTEKSSSMYGEQKLPESQELPQKPISRYLLPPFSLLRVEPQVQIDDWDDTDRQMEVLSQTLENFHVKGDVIGATKGPTVTRFEVQPAPGVKVNKFTGLIDDIKLALAAKDIRMEAPIPGRSAIGIEVPNEKSTPVFLRSLVESDDFLSHPSPLAIALGRDISGQPIIGDLKTMPHGLIAGSTGSGKSVCINSIIVSLLYKAAPSEVRLILIDPKVVELAPYNHIPHLLTPVVSDAKQATAALKWAVEEMDRRYSLFADCGARDMERYNRQMEKQNEQKLPYIVIIIDELADLMMVAPHDVEEAICRIAQKARACGIHLLVATQRPSVDVITGLIKANIPSRIAFAVSSQADSRTILDMGGAERLLGRGDMLYYPSGQSKPVRVQGNFVSDDEIERVIEYVKGQQPVSYLFEKEDLCQRSTSISERDELFEEALLFTVDQGQASASSLQRRFRIGYNRAARLIDQMEAEGFISGQSGSKPRDILLSREEYEELFG
jgi:DNA segregation ATPase FtsK/SpoIIIE-like protein